MNIELHASRIAIDEELRQFVRRLADFALSGSRNDIEYVRVHVAAAGAAQGNGDKRCRVQVGLAGTPGVLVEGRDANLYTAIHRALDRAGWMVTRELAHAHRRAVTRMLDEQGIDGRPAQHRAA